jgi:uncharacterized membrane protein
MLINGHRFHAWQSSLLFTFMFVVHVIFSWSSILSWLIFVGDLGLIGLLTYKAYVDGELHFAEKSEDHSNYVLISLAATLDRYEIPFFGPLATSILDDE